MNTTAKNNKIYIKFRGIDHFNRPIFEDKANKHFYGACECLFGHDATEEDVKKRVKTSDLLFFGYHFGCEPYGCDAKGELVIL